MPLVATCTSGILRGRLDSRQGRRDTCRCKTELCESAHFGEEKDRTLTLVLQLEEWGKGTGRSLATLAALWSWVPVHAFGGSLLDAARTQAVHPTPIDEQQMVDGPLSPSWSSQIQKPLS